jgi:lysophospholipase L1-like esterase
MPPQPGEEFTLLKALAGSECGNVRIIPTTAQNCYLREYFKFEKMYRFLSLVLAITIYSFSLQAQDPLRFKQEVQALHKRDSIANLSKPIVFAGSSTINNWKDIRATFPDHPILNHGFGGSQMSDLLFYADPLIVACNPSQIFIYEGDNDLNSGKSAEIILADASRLLAIIRKELPRKVPVVFISAKPSLARWRLKEDYEAFNKKLKRWTKRQRKVKFVDVWTPMLDQNGEPFKDIFLGDGLHMNKKGYEIWTSTIRPYLRRKR